MESIFYANGEFLSESKSFINLCSKGLLRSYDVLNLLITYNRQHLRLIEHLDRLMNSARLIDLDIP